MEAAAAVEAAAEAAGEDVVAAREVAAVDVNFLVGMAAEEVGEEDVEPHWLELFLHFSLGTR